MQWLSNRFFRSFLLVCLPGERLLFPVCQRVPIRERDVRRQRQSL